MAQHTCTGCVPIDAKIIDVYIQLLGLKDSTIEAAERAEYAAEQAIGKSPYIGENGDWWEWDDEQGAFIDTGVQAQGSIAVDTSMSSTSTNPVQNKVITAAMNEKQDVVADLTTIRSGAAAGATAYQKPGTGIPSTDMASSVQTSLGKADSAYQKPSGGIPKTDLASGVQTSLGKADTAYQRPASGIPASDIASGVIPDVSGKQDTLVSGTNIKTVNGESILGSGNITAGDPNAVKYVAQTLTDAQKTQACSNIGAAAASALSALETAIAAKYSKPSGGIPETDLASAVQSALSLARTSIQSLANYYSKTEVDALLDAVGSEQYVDVTTLPTASASTLGKIYLVGPDANGFYDRYYTSYDGSTYSWVAAGNTEINLANYATKDELSQLQQKVDDISTGKYYGYYATASDLPEDVTVDGFAYVGSGPTYTIYNCEGGVWTSSGITVNQSPVGNDEDIDQNEDGKLQFANRVYNAQQPNGMGYKILRKNASFASQVTDTNTIYEIRYDFSLENTTVTIPSGCVLKFNGGTITNGTINLHGDCEIEGSGICCDISNPSKNLMPLSCYLADISDTSRNRKVVQALLDSGAPVIIDYPSLTFDGELLVKDYATVKSGCDNYINVELNFPDSRGFVFAYAVYSKDIVFEGLTINSDGHCFDLCNSNQNNYPLAIYHAIFDRLELESASGNCIHGGNNGVGSTGGALVFDSTFKNINTRALNGAGFVGLLSNTLLFQKCSCHGCGVAFFVNCSGLFDSCNGTWGNSTPTFLKGNYISGNAIVVRAQMNNCNFESFTSSIIDCPSTSVYVNLTIQNCTIQPPSGTIGFYLFNIAQLDRLIFLSNIVGNASYDSSHTEWYIGNPLNQNSKIISDVPLSATDRNNAKYEYPAITTLKKGTFIQSANFGKDIFLYENYLEADHFQVGEFLLKPKELVVDDTIILNLSGATRHYKLKVSSNDTQRNIVLQYVTIPSVFGNSLQRIGIEFYVENSNANASYVLYHGLGYGTGFISITGENIVLAPGEAARCIWYQGSKCLVYPATASVNAMRRVGTTSDRPTTPYMGFTYFDTTGGKMIVWNGTAWVNMDGTAL